MQQSKLGNFLTSCLKINILAWLCSMGINPWQSVECIEGSGIKEELILIMCESIKLQPTKNTVMASSVRSSSKNSCSFFVCKYTMLPPEIFSGEGKTFAKLKEMLVCIILLWSDWFPRGVRAEQWVQVLVLILWFVRCCCWISLVL